jgi:hypothetical protein
LDASSFDKSIERANGVVNSPNAERGPSRCARMKLAAAATLQRVATARVARALRCKERNAE